MKLVNILRILAPGYNAAYVFTIYMYLNKVMKSFSKVNVSISSWWYQTYMYFGLIFPQLDQNAWKSEEKYQNSDCGLCNKFQNKLQMLYVYVKMCVFLVVHISSYLHKFDDQMSNTI